MPSEKIPGIYNYCDRWCERCAFTKRCAVFADEHNDAKDSRDVRSEAFWQRLKINFTKAKDLLEQAAHQYGLDLKTLAQEASDYDMAERVRRRESREHPLAILSEEYGAYCMEWIQTQPGMIEKLESLKADLSMGVAKCAEANQKIERIKDSISIIQWYETFIHVKLIRALMAKSEEQEEGPQIDEHGNPYPSDHDGSAKIAIIGMDRSLQAWQALFEIFPDQEDEFLKKLGVLQKMRRLATEAFPNAMAFKRPGFDD